MDQLRPIIAGIKKYNFWIVLCLALMILLFFWWISDGIFRKPFTKNSGHIKKQISAIDTLAQRPTFANQTWITGIGEAQKELDTRLTGVAKDNYNEQRPARDWGEFGEVRSDRKLSEAKRKKYWQDFLPQQTEELLKTVDATVDPNATGKLIWNAKNYNAIVSKLVPAMIDEVQRAQKIIDEHEQLDDDDQKRNEENVKKAKAIVRKSVWPNESEVIATQEQIWAYQGLLRSVAALNKGDNIDRFNLPVRAIERIKIWPDADSTANTKTKLVTRRVRKAGARSNESPAATGLPLPQVKDYYRVIPARIELEMDPQHVASLLVALANDPLTCEVVDVHLTSHAIFKKVEEPAAPMGMGAPRPAIGGLPRQGLGGLPGQGAEKPPEVKPPLRPGKRVMIDALIYVAKPPKKKET